MRVIFFICLSLMVISKHRFDSTIYPCIVIQKIKIFVLQHWKHYLALTLTWLLVQDSFPKLC